MRVRLDASNLVAGGGVQVASSFIDELIKLLADDQTQRYPWLLNAEIVLSTSVARNCQEQLPSRVQVLDPRRMVVRYRRNPPDVTFHLFGPRYGPRDGSRVITGFADVLLLYSTAEVLGSWSARQQLRTHMALSWFRRSDRLIVESQSACARLRQLRGFQDKPISVVPNVINGIFNQPERWRMVQDKPKVEGASGVYITRPYAHKNLSMLPAVVDILRDEYKIDFVIIVTMTDSEWRKQPAELRRVCHNMGSMNINQVPTLLRSVDLAIFTSLAECFSVFPLEAMAMRLPLVASDRDYVRESCGDYPVYVDPLSPHSVAAGVAKVLRCSVSQTRSDQRSLPRYTPQDRALRYLEIIQAEMDFVQ